MILMGVTSFYVIFGGMLSVTVTDVIQYILMTISSVFIAVIAFQQTTVEQINAAVPAGWHNLFFGWRLNLDWSQHLPQLNEQIAKDGWELFGIFFIIMMFKGILNSSAGPAPNYDMQRILSTRSPKEAAKMSGFVSVVLFMPRYLMIVGITASRAGRLQGRHRHNGRRLRCREGPAQCHRQAACGSDRVRPGRSAGGVHEHVRAPRSTPAPLTSSTTSTRSTSIRTLPKRGISMRATSAPF